MWDMSVIEWVWNKIFQNKNRVELVGKNMVP